MYTEDTYKRLQHIDSELVKLVEDVEHAHLSSLTPGEAALLERLDIAEHLIISIISAVEEM